MSDMKKIVASKLAANALSDDQLERITTAIGNSPFPFSNIDVCTRGTCVDFTYSGRVKDLKLEDLMGIDIGSVQIIEIFPDGIPPMEQTLIRLTHSL